MRNLANVEARKPSQLVQASGLVCGIMGLPSSGKTSLIETLLDDDSCYPVCAFDRGGGLHVIGDHEDKVQVYIPDDWVQLDKMIDQLIQNPEPFKSVWIDVISNIQDINVEFYGIHDVAQGDARQRQIRYGESNFDIILFHRRLIDELAIKRGINVFFVYWASRPVVVEGSGSPLVTRHIIMSPTVSLKVTGLLDILVYIERQQGLNPWPPTMLLEGDNSIETRLRLNPNHPIKSWPKRVTNPSLSKLVRSWHGELWDE